MSETDRELLELAAKSAGLERTHYRDGCFCYTTRLGGSVKWNPLTDDGDALRLAILCQLGISIVGGRAGLVECVSFKENHCFASSREVADDGDMMEATRRAITRAAAEIGKAMNGK